MALEFLSAFSLAQVLGGIVENRSDVLFYEKWRLLKQNLATLTPEANHELQHAVNRAYLQATLQVCAIRCEQLGIDADAWLRRETLLDAVRRAGEWLSPDPVTTIFAEPERRSAYQPQRLRDWLRIGRLQEGIASLLHSEEVKWLDAVLSATRRQLRELEVTDFFSQTIVSDNELESLLQPQGRKTVEVQKELRESLLDRVYKELNAAYGNTSEEFSSLVKSHWFNFFCANFQYSLKHEESVFRIFMAKSQANLQGGLLDRIDVEGTPLNLEQVRTQLEQFGGELSERVERCAKELSEQHRSGFAEIKRDFDQLLPIISLIADARDTIARLPILLDTAAQDIKHHTSRVTEKVITHVDRRLDNLESTLARARASRERRPVSAPRRAAEELLRDYRKQLFGKVKQVRLFGTEREYELVKVFVELTVATHERPGGETDYLGFVDAHHRRSRAFMWHEPDDEDEDAAGEEGSRGKRRFRPNDLLPGGTKAVITGAPGCGKTTLLRYLCGQMLRRQKGDANEEAQDRWPVFLELKTITPKDFKDARGRLEQLAYTKGVEVVLDADEVENAALKEIFFDALKAGRVNLFLDGLDEVSNTGFFTDLCLSVGEFARSSYSHNTLLISTRPYALHQTRLEGLEEMEIEPFNDRQIEEFLRHYFPDEPAVQGLLAALEQHSGWRDMARVPVLLASLFELYSRQGLSESATRLDVYREITLRLVKKLDSEKPLARKWRLAGDAEGALKLDFLQFLAAERLLFEDYEKYAERFILPVEYIQDKAEEFIKRKRLGGMKAYSLAADVKATPLLREIGSEVYAFSHLTLQEYLSARELAKRRDCVKVFCRTFFNPALLGGEVLPMTLGLVRKPDALYEALERLPESLTFANLRLRARGLSYVKRLDKMRMDGLIERLLEFFREDNAEERPYTYTMTSILTSATGSSRLIIIPHLVKLIRTENYSLRKRAASGLIKLQAKEAIPDLLSALRDKRIDAWVRADAARVLGLLRVTQAVPDLLSILRHEKDSFSPLYDIISVLGWLRAKKAIPELFSILRDEKTPKFQFMERHRAAFALGHMQTTEVIPGLLSVAKDEQINKVVRTYSAEALAEMRVAEAIPDLLSILRDEGVDKEIRTSMAINIGAMRIAAFVPIFLSVLRDEHADNEVRKYMAIGIELARATEAIPDLICVLRDERVDTWVRKWVAVVLGRMMVTEVIPDLISILRDEREDEELPENAARSLGNMRAKEAIPTLVSVLRDESEWGLRMLSAEALGKIRATEVIPDLLSILHDERVDELVRVSMARAIGEMRATEAIFDLIFILRDTERFKRTSMRDEAAKGLGKMQAAEAIPDLLAAFKSRVLWSSAEALEQFSRDNESGFTEGLRKALLHEAPYVRLKAAQMIGYYDTDRQTWLKLSRMGETDPNLKVRQAAATAKEQFASKLDLFGISIDTPMA